jgi:hypothetical protein
MSASNATSPHTIAGNLPEGGSRDQSERNRIEQPQVDPGRRRQIQDEDPDRQQQRKAAFEQRGFLMKGLHADGSQREGEPVNLRV